jgi:hypothetical protein
LFWLKHCIAFDRIIWHFLPFFCIQLDDLYLQREHVVFVFIFKNILISNLKFLQQNKWFLSTAFAYVKLLENEIFNFFILWIHFVVKKLFVIWSYISSRRQLKLIFFMFIFISVMLLNSTLIKVNFLWLFCFSVTSPLLVFQDIDQITHKDEVLMQVTKQNISIVSDNSDC